MDGGTKRLFLILAGSSLISTFTRCSRPQAHTKFIIPLAIIFIRGHFDRWSYTVNCSLELFQSFLDVTTYRRRCPRSVSVAPNIHVMGSFKLAGFGITHCESSNDLLFFPETRDEVRGMLSFMISRDRRIPRLRTEIKN